jgi:hypothetical protein
MTDTNTDNETQPSGSFLLGFGISCLLALVIGVLGGAFEAFILWPIFQVVTVTLGPDFVFLVANFFLRKKYPRRRRTRLGITTGFLAVIITAVVSFFVFFALTPYFLGL